MTADPRHVPRLRRREGRADGAPASSAASASSREADLPPGEVEIRVAWSSVNYKDGLATRADGKVARISPLIPGIDLAGEVVASDGPGDRGRDRPSSPTATSWASRAMAATAEYQRVPAGWVVPLAPGLIAARRDGDRDGRVHRRDVRRGARGPRASSRPTGRSW